MLILHGGGCSSADWAEIALGLARRFRVLAPDQRGHGHSQWAPTRSYPIDDLVADAAELLRQVAGGPAAVVGHSMGAVVALVLAARHPELITSVVLVDGGPLAEGISFPPSPAIPEAFESRDAAIEWVASRRPASHRRAIEREFQTRFVETAKGGVRWRMDPVASTPARAREDHVFLDQWPYVATLKVPTRLIRGGDSLLVPAEVPRRMAAMNPNVSWTEIPGAGHFIHYDEPEELARAIDEFL